jgi:2'-5' RNA ligase
MTNTHHSRFIWTENQLPIGELLSKHAKERKSLKKFGGYDYASSQLNIADSDANVARQVLQLGRQIPEDKLADKGRETTPHVTLRYGLTDDDPTQMRQLLAGQTPVRMRLGDVDAFTSDETGAPYDVVYLTVHSDDLDRLNRTVADNLPSVETHPWYAPHCTLAYVKPGTGKDVAAGLDNPLEGTELTATHVLHSDRGGNLTRIPLTDGQSLRRLIADRLAEIKADADCHWVTLDNDAHVCIGGDGTVHAGPKELEGQKFGDNDREGASRVSLSPSEGYIKTLREDALQRIRDEKAKGKSDFGIRDIYFALGHRADDATIYALAEHIEKASSREAMYDVLESGMRWNRDFKDAGLEWAAARALGGNTDLPKGMKPPSLTDDQKAAFRARMEFVQEHTRQEYNGASTVDVYRGVKGAQGKIINQSDENEIDLKVRSLSSWTPYRSLAQGFAGTGSTGVVLRATVPVRDIFWNNDIVRGMRMFNFSDDAKELVTLTSSATRRSRVM